MSKGRILLTSAITFAIIVSLQSCGKILLKEEFKEGKIIQQSIEEIDFDSLFIPAEKSFEFEIEEPTVDFSK